MTYFAIDTETSNFAPPNADGRLLQLGWASNDIKKAYYIYPDSDLCINPRSYMVNGLTVQFLREHGKSFQEVWNEFWNDIKQCDYVVGFNFKFDLNIIESELNIRGLSLELNQWDKMYLWFMN